MISDHQVLREESAPLASLEPVEIYTCEVSQLRIYLQDLPFAPIGVKETTPDSSVFISGAVTLLNAVE